MRFGLPSGMKFIAYLLSSGARPTISRTMLPMRRRVEPGMALPIIMLREDCCEAGEAAG